MSLYVIALKEITKRIRNIRNIISPKKEFQKGHLDSAHNFRSNYA